MVWYSFAAAPRPNATASISGARCTKENEPIAMAMKTLTTAPAVATKKETKSVGNEAEDHLTYHDLH
jgi:hypothetical protein